MNAYRTLGVPVGADMVTIKRAFRRAARIHHPDRNADVDTVRRMQSVNEAWATLRNPEKKAALDASLRQAGQSSARVSDMGVGRGDGPAKTGSNRRTTGRGQSGRPTPSSRTVRSAAKHSGGDVVVGSGERRVINRSVKGDVRVAAGGSVVVNGSVRGSLFVNEARAVVNGKITGTVYLSGGSVIVNGRLVGGVIQTGGSGRIVVNG